MKNDIQNLQLKFEENQEAYKSKEIGSGIHSFVKDIIKSEKFFNLKETAKKTDKHGTFVHDTEADKNGRPDFILFINDDITIPCEAKCFTRIDEGKEQILKYQLDWGKQYGILTDGSTWRFYNNTSYKELHLSDFLNNPVLFSTFWDEYIKPENYYLSFFEKKGQMSLFKDEDIIKVQDNRSLFFDDITKLIRNFKNKLDIEGYFKNFEKKEAGKKATEISYAYIIQFILYKTLVDNLYANFNEEFSIRIETIYQSLKAKNYNGILNHISTISRFISEKIYKPFNNEQEYIHTKLSEILDKPKNDINDIALWLDIIVFIKKYNFANIKNDIFGYIYENYLKELYEDKNKGQYFTDPAIVNFMLDEIGFTKEEILKRYKNRHEDKSLSLIDPSCGSGTFLYSAIDRIINSIYDETENKSKIIEDLINNHIFGLDIAEFPLYLAEMGILMRMLPLIINEKYNNPIDKKVKLFKTNDSIAEFSDTKLNSQDNDLPLFKDIIKLGYTSYIRDEDDLKEMKESLVAAYRTRFDYVIGNPPYIGYNECCKQNILFTKLIKEKKMSMGNIYGVNLNTVPNRIKKYSPKPNLYSFFCALGLGLLKENGKICYIIPQTILTANDLDVLRFFFAKYTTIEKIITFAGKMFIGRGLKQQKPVATSSLIFVLKRKESNNNHTVKIVNYKDCGEMEFEKFLNSSKKENSFVEQKELLEKVENWNFIKQNDISNKFLKTYKNNLDIQTYRNALSENTDLVFDGGVNINENQIKTIYSQGDYELFDYKNNDWNLFKTKKSNIFYSKHAEKSFPSGSQGMRAFDKKYKIIWRTKFNGIFQYTDRNILLINNQSLIVSSDSQENILFLFALLNSKTSLEILNLNLKLENETNYLIPIKEIKQY
ncbi:MAG: type I restriction endonuclease, partial [Endomicrobiaceae bacterium]|nr:type I restriction endonuclease [Endomicrobiaceae bacterium]